MVERCATTWPRIADDAAAGGSRTACWDLLDLLRRPAVLTAHRRRGSVDAWAETDAPRCRRVASDDGDAAAPPRGRVRGEGPLRDPGTPGPARSVTWRQTAARVDVLARGLVALAGRARPGSRSSPKTGSRWRFADLACQAAGLVSVMIPAQATEHDVAFMLRQSEAAIAIAGSREILATLRRADRWSPDVDASRRDGRGLGGRRRARPGRGRGARRRDVGRRARPPTARGAHRRPRHDHVHVRDDRNAEGDLLFPSEHRLQALRARARAPRDRRGRRLPVLPPAVPHVRPLPRDVRLRLLGGDVRLPRQPRRSRR